MNQLAPALARRLRGATGIGPALLFVEFLDEFVFGAREAAWPQIRDDLGLSYAEVGLLLGLPLFVSNFVEMPIAFLGDTRLRKPLIITGGIFFALQLLLMAASRNFWALLAVFVVLYPAAGGFVGLSQAALVDRDQARREQTMARWTLTGSVGVLVGTLAIGLAASQQISWRVVFLAAAALSVAAVAMISRAPIRAPGRSSETVEPLRTTLTASLAWAGRALRRAEVIRWLVLLELSDLVGDILLSYLALYLVDVAGASPTEAVLGVGVWAAAGLAGDLLVVLLLERIRGLTYLRLNSLASVGLLAGFLALPGLPTKALLGGALGLAMGGRYAILKAQLYDALPGRSSSARALNNVSKVAGSLLPAAIGAAAAAWGLSSAMWLLMAGPLALLIATPAATRLEPE